MRNTTFPFACRASRGCLHQLYLKFCFTMPCGYKQHSWNILLIASPAKTKIFPIRFIIIDFRLNSFPEGVCIASKCPGPRHRKYWKHYAAEKRLLCWRCHVCRITTANNALAFSSGLAFWHYKGFTAGMPMTSDDATHGATWYLERGLVISFLI